MRFASHRDIARAVERAVRMAGLPVGYSAGFSPHPRISYSPGAPTGAASEAEYLELSLTEARGLAEVRDGLDAALPGGLDVLEVSELAERSAGPPLEASTWQVVLPGITPDQAAEAAAAFLAAPSAEVDRLTSKGTRRLDARAAVVSMSVDQRAEAGSSSENAILRLVVRQLTPAVRPDDILAALRRMTGLQPSSPPLVTRLAQGPLGKAARGTAQGQVTGACLDAGTAELADAAPVSAQEQLPRGATDPEGEPRAREPDEKESPNARDRATERRRQ